MTTMPIKVKYNRLYEAMHFKDEASGMAIVKWLAPKATLVQYNNADGHGYLIEVEGSMQDVPFRIPMGEWFLKDPNGGIGYIGDELFRKYYVQVLER